MFAWWGRTVYRYRYIVIGVMVALCLGGGVFGISLGNHVTQSGFYDDGSQSVHASVVADKAYGRDTSGHIIGIYTAPEGKTVDDPDFKKKILDNLAQVEKDHPDQILRSIGYFKSPDVLKNMADADKQHAFMSIQLKGDNDDADPEQLQRIGQGRPAQGQATTASTSSWPACSRWRRVDRHHRRRPEARRGRGHPAGRAWCCSSCSAASSRPPSRRSSAA